MTIGAGVDLTRPDTRTSGKYRNGVVVTHEQHVCRQLPLLRPSVRADRGDGRGTLVRRTTTTNSSGGRDGGWRLKLAENRVGLATFSWSLLRTQDS